MLTDTHCHLYLEQFEPDLEEVLQRAADAGVQEIWLPAIDWQSIDRMERLSHPKIRFHKMAGIHPCSIQDHWPLDEERLWRLAEERSITAIGETGLDYYWSRDHIREQKESLRVHCRVARSTGKPIVLHNRESTEDLIGLLESEQDGSLKGVWHCFSGSREEAFRAVDLGLYLGIGGLLTFKNGGVDRVAADLPAERLLLETDAPYLAPVPHRGKRNEPSYVIRTAERLAELLGLSLQQVAELTTENARRLFGTEA